MSESPASELVLPGIGMGGYRSLFDLQVVGPLRKVTLIAGQNNTGKSNILRFASLLLTQGQLPIFEWFDNPVPPGPPLRLQMAYSTPTTERLERMHVPQPERSLQVFSGELFHPVLDDNVWLTYSSDPRPGVARTWRLDEDFLVESTRRLVGDSRHVLSQMSSAMTGTAGGPEPDDMRRVLERLFPFDPPPVETVGAFRQIVEAPPSEVTDFAIEDFSGRDLVKRLAMLESPPAERYSQDRARFDAINQFARTVLEDREVEIRISAQQTEIQVHQGDRVFPLSSLGTGIHQVIILATAASLLEHTLVCIEEPEVFLHPILQRKLVRYLSEVTSNQYLIATHSAHMLDYERACVLHVTHDPEGGTLVSRAESLQDVSDLCGDLGYRPSDLIQANAVVWVEGPSDRIYLNHWLRLTTGDEFVEGIHYSVMFYGGALLPHLTGNDPDPSIEEFISLRRLNRHSAILIDSDKPRAGAALSATKIRIVEEFDREDMPGFAWVTACRTIENYVPVEILTDAVNACHPRLTYTLPRTKWDNPLALTSRVGGLAHADKVRIARNVCERWSGEQLPRNIHQQMTRIAGFIRTANGTGDRPLPEEPSAPS